MKKELLVAAAALLNSIGMQAQTPVVVLDTVATGLEFLVDVEHVNDDRLFCLAKNGVVRIVVNGEVLSRPFLDIAGYTWGTGELGAVGLEFDPEYDTSGIFYLNYTALGDSGVENRISRFRVSPNDPDSADHASEQILYRYPQPSQIHKGGHLEFGADGYLYMSTGDGNVAANGQDLTTSLGCILRVDVSDPDTTFTIPPDNPFANAGGDTLPEIWAYGFRNPWRFALDELTGDMWIGDVGSNDWEEIDLWPAGDNSGPNFGWDCFEGLVPVPDAPDCGDDSLYEMPVQVHAHSAGWCAIVGGRVYRGNIFPALYGRYIYTDLCSGTIRSLLPDGDGGWTGEDLSTEVPYGIVSMGVDQEGELLVCHSGGTLYRLEQLIPTATEAIGTQREISIHPNPATDRMIVTGEGLERAGIRLYDPIGRTVAVPVVWNGSDRIELDVKALSNGTHLLVIVAGDGTISRSRFTVLH